MEETTQLPPATQEEVVVNETKPAKNSKTKPYILDALARTITVDYPDRKFKLRHSIVSGDNRDYIKYYHEAPSIKANKKGEVEMLGTPSAPAAELHDTICNGVIRTSMDGKEEKPIALEDVRELRPSLKADGVISYIGGFYEVELKTESGDLDDLLFDRAVTLTAEVKVRPDGNKVDQTFKVFLTRPDGFTQERLSSQSSSTSIVDEKRDEILQEFIGDEHLAAMTGDEDEGERVAFTKTVQHVRYLFDAVDKSITGFENVSFKGGDFSPADLREAVAKMDPVLKLAIGAELRNFI